MCIDYQVSLFLTFNYTMQDITEKILSFCSLSNNWDGYGAIPLEVKSAANATKLFDLLDDYLLTVNNIYPNPHGTITFDWDSYLGNELSLEIGNETMSYYFKRHNDVQPLCFDNVPINSVEAQKLNDFLHQI